jgi:twitching motility protein PilT
VHIDDLLKYTKEVDASDLHLKPMRPPLVRIKGKLLPIKAEPLQPQDIESMVKSILSPKQISKLEEFQSADFGYGVKGVARFRGNAYYQRGTMSAAFRRIPYDIKKLDDLNLPKVLHEMCNLPDGMVLITGPTGMGKSTTLAGIIREISETRYQHIVTIEDPIEFLFSDKAATVSQREVGTDTPLFKEALKNAMRQDPDVIMVGEMRDADTISTVMTAAETGHLVFSTLHTNNAGQTVDRIIDAFPPGQHKQVRAQLAQVLRGIVSLRLVPKADNSGMVAVTEVMKNTPRIAKLIEEGNIKDISEEIETSVAHFRMQTLNQSFIALIVNGIITYTTAMNASQDPDDLSLKLRKLFPHIEDKARGGVMPSTADFAEIQELMGIKKMYEEQEEKFRMRLQEKEEAIAHLEDDMAELRQRQLEEVGNIKDFKAENEKLKKELESLRKDAQEKLRTLQDRIKELNQQLMDSRSKSTTAVPTEDKKPSGFFKR